MDGMGWFPQEYADHFHAIKGVVALLATCLLVVHMGRTWNTVQSTGQRLRYYTLFYFAVLITASSVEQTAQDAPVNLRNIGAVVGVALLVAAMWVSLRETRQSR